MKRIIGLIICLNLLAAYSGFSQNISFELSDRKFTVLDGKQYYEFQVLISSQKSRRLHSGQLYFNYQEDVLGKNLVSQQAVTYGTGPECLLFTSVSGNSLFKDFVLNDNRANRFSFAWQNYHSCNSQNDSSVIDSEKQILVSFSVMVPSGIETEGLDLNTLVCFESGDLYDSQTFECLGETASQIVFDSYSCYGQDLIAPVSQMSENIPEIVNDPSVTLSWSGSDNPGGSGIDSYDLYVSINGGEFQLFESGISDPSFTFFGTNNTTYSFYTIATDKAGNRESEKTTGEVTVLFDVILKVADNNLGTTISASPNPMEDRFTLKLGDPIENMEIHVFNVYGETVFRGEYQNKDTAEITFQGASGVYFVKIVSSDEKSTLFKIVKN